MIEEIYVSFEIAKLLKEKGFNVFGDGSYGTETEIHREYSPFGKIRDCSTSKPSQKGYPAPTQQMAMKWLREVHNIHISIYVFNRELPITNVPIFYTCDIATEKLSSQQGHLRGMWKSYEEACESAIKYCLEHLI